MWLIFLTPNTRTSVKMVAEATFKKARHVRHKHRGVAKSYRLHTCKREANASVHFQVSRIHGGKYENTVIKIKSI